MASLYEREGSPYFWIKYRDERGVLRQVSTRFKIGVSTDVRRARAMVLQRSSEELGRGEIKELDNAWVWATEFLKVRYQSQPLTLERYLCSWASISLFLAEQGIQSPRHVLRQHCYDFIAWRRKADKPKGKYGAKFNTALMDLKALRIVLQEAVVRGIITGNPALKLGLKKERPKEKPELTAEDCQAIRKGIEAITDPARRTMLTNSFEIARLQGCRLSETRLDPMNDVDIKNGTIRFRSAKGGVDFTTRLHPGLHALFAKLQSEKRRATWETPPNRGRQWASTNWYRFLRDIGLTAKGVTFHSTRVTVVTELARNDVHESKAKAYVGHASTTVHAIYQRLQPNDLGDCTSAVGSGTLTSSSKSDGPSAT